MIKEWTNNVARLVLRLQQDLDNPHRRVGLVEQALIVVSRSFWFVYCLLDAHMYLIVDIHSALKFFVGSTRSGTL